jgi:NAD(P)-dependent dehydrogenase (short-subunit alcohol dehydrogenase family)
MTLDLQGERVVVTGGASGIGLATARLSVAAGAAVWVIDLPGQKPAHVAGTIGAQGIEADVADLNSLRKAFSKLDDVSIAIVNAGIAPCGCFLDVSPDLWQRVLSINLNGAFYTAQLAAEKMKLRRRGSIVFTASTNSYDGEPNLTAYNASKAALLGILHTAANELGPYGVRVNAVCPGLIRTPLTRDTFSDESALSKYFAQIPLGRGGEAEEVAQAILFLASNLASYITGATLLVDGGQMASKFGTWGKDGDYFDGQRWHRNE